MKIGFGSTRFVLIFSKIVVKIPRVRIFRIFKRTLETKLNNTLSQKTRNYSKRSKIFAVIRYLLVGVYANRMEYNYFKKHKDLKELLPVRSLLFGFLEIQEKGTVLSNNDPTWLHLFNLLKIVGVNDVASFKASNFCRCREHLRILDYANEETIDILENWHGIEMIKMVNSNF